MRHLYPQENNKMLRSKDIVMTGYAATKGASVIAGHYCHNLINVLPESIVNRVCGYSVDTDNTEIAGIADEYEGVIRFAGYGGIFKALRDIADEKKTGITIWLEKISISQETIEICEVLDINPYILDATGAAIIITQYGNELVRAYEEAGIMAVVIGYTTDNNDKIVVNNGEIRHLETRIRDELCRLDKIYRSDD